MELKRVVITGMGALTPLGNNLEDYWKNLQEGVSGAARITYFDPELHKTQFACELKNFEVTDFIHKKEARKIQSAPCINSTPHTILSSKCIRYHT